MEITGKDWEDKIEAALIANNMEYTRENSKRAYGVARGSKGKFDFETKSAAIECKTVGRASNLRLPLPGKTNTALKTHQLAALRKQHANGKKAGLMIYIQDQDLMFWLPIRKFYEIIVDHGLIKHLSIDHLESYAVQVSDLAEFFNAEMR